MKINLSLVLPIHNQETIIKPVIDSINKVLKNNLSSYEIIAVENGSQDFTYKVLINLQKKYKNLKVIIAKKGYGSAIIAGLKEAKGKYLCYMPSDGQLDPNLIPKLYKIITKSNYDLVKVRRITRESLIRTIRSKIFNILAKALFSIPVSDINGNPRIFLSKWLPILKLQYKDSFIDAEMAIKAYELRWRIKEIPAKTLPRLGGKSTVNIKTIIEFIRNLIFYKLDSSSKKWLTKNQDIIVKNSLK